MILHPPRPEIRPAAWQRCADLECGVMWRGDADEPCWACDGPSVKAFGPVITSQSGFAPPARPTPWHPLI